jgi:hypothetical protein
VKTTPLSPVRFSADQRHLPQFLHGRPQERKHAPFEPEREQPPFRPIRMNCSGLDALSNYSSWKNRAISGVTEVFSATSGEHLISESDEGSGR